VIPEPLPVSAMGSVVPSVRRLPVELALSVLAQEPVGVCCTVALCAKPLDVKRALIIGMMPHWLALFLALGAFLWPLEIAGLDRLADLVPCPPLSFFPLLFRFHYDKHIV
jgi:hypothetical protein